MKNLFRAIFCVVITSICLNISAQEIKKHSIGLQLNPYLDENLFNGAAIKPVYALRYTFGIKDHITLGPEVSGYYVKVLADNSDFSISSFNIGGYFRYSFLPTSRIKPFIEISPYYTFHSYKNGPEISYDGTEPNGSDSYVSGFIAPGLSLFNKSRRFSLDLFYKFSNESFVNEKKSVFSYRLNFNF